MIINKYFICFFIAAGLPSLSWAQSASGEKIKIDFVSKQMGVPVEGGFKKAVANVNFDKAQPATSKAEIEIDLASIDTGSDDADTEVKRKGWFNVQEFPTAKFVSTAVKDVGGGRYEVNGKLTIKGKTRDIMAPFLLKLGTNGASVAEGKFVIKRSQFSIGEGVWADPDTVADEVEVKFKVPLTASGATNTPKK
jgi:polyisoprenoid-binding protein YceI